MSATSPQPSPAQLGLLAQTSTLAGWRLRLAGVRCADLAVPTVHGGAVSRVPPNSLDMAPAEFETLRMPDEPMIDLQSDDYFMGEALRQAARAYAAEEVPVGAVIVQAGRIIARAFNQVELLKDATAHAEMLALTQAQAAVGDWRLTDCTLYVTKEPCPMCAGAVVHTRLARVVFGAGDPKGGAAGGAMNVLQFPTLNHRCDISGQVRAEECRQLLKTFFARQRQAGDKP